MEQRKEGKPIEFSIEFCKKSTGELITYERAVLSSFHSSGSTVNILQITRFNNIKVYF